MGKGWTISWQELRNPKITVGSGSDEAPLAVGSLAVFERRSIRLLRPTTTTDGDRSSPMAATCSVPAMFLSSEIFYKLPGDDRYIRAADSESFISWKNTSKTGEDLLTALHHREVGLCVAAASLRAPMATLKNETRCLSESLLCNTYDIELY